MSFFFSFKKSFPVELHLPFAFVLIFHILQMEIPSRLNKILLGTTDAAPTPSASISLPQIAKNQSCTTNTPRNGIAAFHMRHLAAAKSRSESKTEPPPPESKVDSDQNWWTSLRCTHCGFQVTPSDRLPVTNRYDSRIKTIEPDADWKKRYYMRMPYTTCNSFACAPVVEDSDFVFCCNQCVLTYMLQSISTSRKEAIVDRLNDYLTTRFKLTEPSIVAPPAHALAYLTGTRTGLSHDQFYELVSTLKYQVHIA